MTDADSYSQVTSLPEFEAPASDERTTLTTFLDYFRIVLVRKVEGLTDEQARLASCPPSDLNLLGLVRHMADVERVWAQWRFAGGVKTPIYFAEAHPDGDVDGDFHPAPIDTVADAVATFWAEVAAADAIYAAASLGDIERDARGAYSLRWILTHLIEEYARHCGHADLLREAIDGVTGD